MNNKIKITLSIFLIACLTCSVLLSQNKSKDYQTLLAKAQILFSKSPESLNKNDIAQLDDLIKLDVNSFGEENVRLCRNLIEQAKKKKVDYEQYVEQMNNMSSTLDKLDDETTKRQDAENLADELIFENENLQQIIEELNLIIARYEQQKQRLNAANNRLQKENLAVKDLLKESNDIVAQMLTLMPDIKMDNITKSSLQKTLRDSLEYAQCGVAQLLKSNFLITIQQLKSNQQFIDSASEYYKNNKAHINEIQNYMNGANELANRLRKNGAECAVSYAADIETEMNDFINGIENPENHTDNFLQFIIDNIYWLVPVLLVLVVCIIILIKNTSKSSKKQTE